MAELNLSERSSVEVGRDSDGAFMWRVNVYFPDTTDISSMIALIDRLLVCKGHIEIKAGKPAVGVDIPTESGASERRQGMWEDIEKAEHRLLVLHGRARSLSSLVDLLDERVKARQDQVMSKGKAPKPAEGEGDDTEEVSIPISEPEEKEKAGKRESRKA